MLPRVFQLYPELGFRLSYYWTNLNLHLNFLNCKEEGKDIQGRQQQQNHHHQLWKNFFVVYLPMQTRCVVMRNCSLLTACRSAAVSAHLCSWGIAHQYPARLQKQRVRSQIDPQSHPVRTWEGHGLQGQFL